MSAVEPVPLERGRAEGLLTGLAMFVTGFAVAGVLVSTGFGSTPPYYMVGSGAIGSPR